ncbi:MAG: hypothetical protein KGH89_08905 [Thaumarchaeota archaeon]|nr:hypothetical protein [Nitrososphaerota archaeon]
MENTENILYREAQTFSHSSVWLVVLCITFSSVYFGLPQLFEIAGDRSPTTTIVVASSIFLAIGFILPVLLLMIKLRIQVRNDGLYIRVVPFQSSFKKISLADLQDCKSYEQQEKEENKLGLRYAISKKAYSLGGKRGIKLELKNGQTILVESKRPEKIIQAIKTASSKNA